MAVSKVLSLVLLGLCGAALAKPNAPAASTTAAATTTVGGTGSTTQAAAGGVQDCLSDADKDHICKVPATGPGLCASAGPADDFCSKLAASVNGTSPSCVASNVCSFKVNGNASTTVAGTGSTTAGTGSTTPAGTGSTPAGAGVTKAGTGTTSAGTGSTPAGAGVTTAGTGTTSAGTGSTPAGTGVTTAGTGSTTVGSAGPAIVPEPNTAYVSCNATPAGFQELKICPSSKTIFVYPSASGSSGSTPAGTGSTPAGTGLTTTVGY